MAGYTRQDTANNIANGNVIDADDFDAEYNAIEGAFNNTSGHTHDGTSGEGAPITKVGPAQDLIVSGTAVLPKVTNTLDLGSASLQYKDAFFDGNVNLDTLEVDENATITGTLGVTGATTLSSSLDVTGDTGIDGSFNINTNKFTVDSASGNTTVAGTLGVTGATTLSSTLDVTGATTLSSTLGVTGAATLSSTLGVTGATTLSDTLAVTGAASMSSTLGVTGATTLFNTLAVTGGVTAASTVDISGATGIDGDFDVNTNKFTVASATGNTAIAGTLAVTGASTFTGAVSAPAGITANITGDITGDVTGNITGNVTSTGANSMASLTTTGDVVVGGNLTVSGTTTTVNTETINLADNQILLNSNYTGSTPTENGGIEIERGTLANKTLVWDEAADKWTVGSETFVAGTFEGSLTGNASTASTLQTARTIALGGDVTGSVSFNGGSDVTITATIADDSHNHVISNVDGLQTALDGKAALAGSAGQVFSASTLNATTVDLGDWTVTESAGVLYFATGGTNKMKLDASGNLTVVGNVTAYGTV